jgi:hypothetical protein
MPTQAKQWKGNVMKKYSMINIYLYFITTLFIAGSGIAAQKYSSWDQFRYAGPGLKQIGVLAVKHSREIKASPWSVGCETLDRDYGDFSKYKDYVGELGVKRARIQSGWAKCEKEKGVYDFTWLDPIVKGLKEQTVEPWMCLCYGNPLYNSDIDLNAKLFSDDKTMSAWLNYVEATVKQYKDTVKEWEIWNEINHDKTAAKNYAALLMKTAERIRKVQPDAIIIGFAMVRVDLKFTKEVFEILKENNQAGILNYVSYHPYVKNPDSIYDDVSKLKELVDSYDPNIKLFQGESGCPSALEWTHALPYYPWTEISQAKWLMRRMAGDRVRDIRTSIFTIVDLKYPNMLQSFGLLRANLLHEIIYKRPSYYGVQNMAGFFDDTVTPVGELEYQSWNSREMTVAKFQKNDKPVLLVWYKDCIPDDKLEWDILDITINGVNFKDPVYVEMVSGKVFEINDADWSNKDKNVKFVNLPVWDSVIMITERSNIDMKTK